LDQQVKRVISVQAGKLGSHNQNTLKQLYAHVTVACKDSPWATNFQGEKTKENKQAQIKTSS